MSDAIERVGMVQPQLTADAWTRERIELVKKTVCPQGIPDADFALFIEQCKRSGLDPLLKEAFCVKRRQNIGNKERPNWIEKYEFQPAESGFLSRAEQFPDFRGVSASAVYSGDEIEVDAGAGTVVHKYKPTTKRGSLLGAWARVERANKVAVVVWLELGGYQQSSSMWSKIPATMMEKCARVSALRKAYPSAFGGLYINEEMPESEERPAIASNVTVEAQAQPQLPAKTATEAKAQLAAKVAAMNGAVVDAPKKSRMHVEDVTANWERIKAAGLAASMSPEDITKEALRIGGKTKRAELTAADADKFCAWVEDALDSLAPPPPSEPPPNLDEAAPF